MTPPRLPLLRCALAGLTVVGLAALVVGFWNAAREAAFQGWSALGLDWLEREVWANQRPLGLALAVGLVAAGLFLGLERSRSRAPGVRIPRAVGRVLGSPFATAFALLLCFGLPRTVARHTRPVAPAQAPNVLFVLVDTWRADHVGFLGYQRDVSPKLDALAERGVIFERAISSSGWTKPAVATLLTGLMPSKHCAVSQPLPHTPVRGGLLPPFVTTFVEVFRAKGWDTAMWSNNPNITPPRGFDQGAGYFRDYFHDPAKTVDFDPGRSERMLPDVEAWLEARAAEERPFCAYLHIMDPHYPYVAPAPFAGKFDRSGLDFQLTGPVAREIMTGKRDRRSITSEMQQRILDIYDEELLYVDHHLGAFLERVLEQHPNTIVVLSGDHGEEFLEHGNYGHGHAIWQELTHVPLVLWAPDLEPERVSQQVRLMDVFPTLMELAGVPEGVGEAVQGASLLPLIDGREAEDRWAPMETGGDQKPAWQWRAISDGRYKYLRREKNLPTKKRVPPLTEFEDPDALPTEYLFDLRNDPREEHNLLEQDPERASELLAGMRERGWYVEPSELLKIRARTANIDESDAGHLQHLGYGGEGDP